MHPEIEKLIDLIIADGQVTDKERKVILKKAIELGEDSDEIEIIIDAKLYQLQLNKSSNTNEKVGNLKTCPSCGNCVPSFKLNCIACNHEFTNASVNNSIQKLFLLLNQCENERENQDFTIKDTISGLFARAYGFDSDKITEKKKSIISGFPIPNTKEDILEFLSLAIPNSKQKGNFFTKNQPENKSHNDLAPTWQSKCEQIIMKARFAMREDSKTLNEIEYYAIQLGIK